MNLIWVAIACFGGAILGNISNLLANSGITAKAFWQGILAGIIAALVFAGAYQINGGTITTYDIFAAVVAGWGTVMGQSHIGHILVARNPKSH